MTRIATAYAALEVAQDHAAAMGKILNRATADFRKSRSQVRLDALTDAQARYDTAAAECDAAWEVFYAAEKADEADAAQAQEEAERFASPTLF